MYISIIYCESTETFNAEGPTTMHDWNLHENLWQHMATDSFQAVAFSKNVAVSWYGLLRIVKTFIYKDIPTNMVPLCTFFLNSWRLSQSASHCERCNDDLLKNWNSTWIYKIPPSFSNASQVERLFLEVFCISPWKADCHQGETVHSWPQIGWEVATEWILVAVENRSKLWSGKHPSKGKSTFVEPKVMGRWMVQRIFRISKKRWFLGSFRR